MAQRRVDVHTTRGNGRKVFPSSADCRPSRQIDALIVFLLRTASAHDRLTARARLRSPRSSSAQMHSSACR